MKNVILLFITVVVTISCCAQNFEGRVIYKNAYKIKLAGLTDEKFTEMMGDTQEYYIKEGAYKSMMNGTLVQWQLYTNKDNKLYTKMSSAADAFWNDGAQNPDEVIKAEINKAVTVVLGYKCDELVLTCKTGVQKYYFNAGFPVNVKLLANHKFGNWYDVVSRTKALPLKMIIDNAQFYVETIATEIKPMALQQSFFELPAGINTIKSPH